MLTKVLTSVQRLVRAGSGESTRLADLEVAFMRHATLLMGTLGSAIAGVVLIASGSLFHGAMAVATASGCVLGYTLSVRGYSRIGPFLTLVTVNTILTLGVTAEGAENLAILHIFAVCLPFSLYHSHDRWYLLGGIGLTVIGVLISTIPLVPSPWLAHDSDVAGHVRATASISMSVIIASQLWFFLTNRDRTLQRLSVALEQAEAGSRTKSAFLANMSHEIRTPINGVLGILGILEDTDLDEQQREYARTARSSGMILLDVISDILDLSKVEAGQMRIEPVPFDLRSSLEDTIDQFAFQIEPDGLELILSYAPGTPEYVVADAGRVRQLINNLVSNAVKFTERGHVLVTVTCRERWSERAVLKISVEDTGPGVAERDLEHIFDKFRQVDDSATRKHTGTGLGLAICKELVRLMGGDIGAYSKPGQGSTFWFTLPVVLDEALVMHRAPPEELAGVRVLIVDDHPVARRVLHEQFAGWGSERHAACESGRAALDVLRAARRAGEPFDVAVLDHHMPDLDGVALARAIKGDEDLADTVLILLTLVTLPLDIEAITAAGFAGYLVKPAHRSELHNVVAAAWHTRERSEHEPITRHLLREHERDQQIDRDIFKGLKTLVVDDNAINQKVATKLLESLGCRVDVAADGREALAMLEAASYEIVLMDVQMPGMDGLEATRRLRAIEQEREIHTPVVAMTAHAMVGDRELCIASGMDGYVSKPVDREDLAREMAKYIQPK